VELGPPAVELACPACDAKFLIPAGTAGNGKIGQCLVCPSTELFIRKDFSQPLGVAIVVVGVVVSSVFWAYRMPFWTYAVLFATALIDVVLYLTVGNVLQCYRCQAQYRDVPGLENYGGFSAERIAGCGSCGHDCEHGACQNADYSTHAYKVNTASRIAQASARGRVLPEKSSPR
jgi:hypothetical protein